VKTVNDINATSLKDAFLDKKKPFCFEIKDILTIKNYKDSIDFYVGRLRAGATAGVRGKIDINDFEKGEVSIAMAAFLAQAYAEFLTEKIKNKHNLTAKTLVGFDTRYHSEAIAEMMARVLAGNGFEVLINNIDSKSSQDEFISPKPSPTPVNSLLTFLLGCAGSLNVTASHNPANQNGIKPNNEKGHLDSDDDLERFLDVIEKLYNNGNGSGNIIMSAFNDEKIKGEDFEKVYNECFIETMKEDGFIDTDIIMEAMNNNWEFVIDSIGGTGGVMMEKILDYLFADKWQNSIHIINKAYDPDMCGIAKPDPTIPKVMESSGLLEKMGSKNEITSGGTGDNDWDRFTAAIKIDKDHIKKTKENGLYVPDNILTPIVQFTADQMYTFFGEYQLRKIAQSRYFEQKKRKVDVYSKALDEAIKSRQIDLSDCYLITTYPSSLLSDYLVDYYGANIIYTSVGFKNIGITVANMLEGAIGKNSNIIYVLGKEESGGCGFGFQHGWLEINGKRSLGAKDKDTSLNVLKLMEISSYACIKNKTIVDLYADMLKRLGVITYYERLDWYVKDGIGEVSDDAKCDKAKKIDALEEKENANIVARLLGEELDGSIEMKENLKNSYLWVKIASNGDWLFNRVYDPPEKRPAKINGEWKFMNVKVNKYMLKSGKYFTIFHAGEGPKITLFDKNGKAIYWTLIRPSGTERGLIRHYNEIVCSNTEPDPGLLMKYARRFLDYFGMDEYYDGGLETIHGRLRKKYGVD
jgi:phosphomannomutase